MLPFNNILFWQNNFQPDLLETIITPIDGMNSQSITVDFEQVVSHDTCGKFIVTCIPRDSIPVGARIFGTEFNANATRPQLIYFLFRKVLSFGLARFLYLNVR